MLRYMILDVTKYDTLGRQRLAIITINSVNIYYYISEDQNVRAYKLHLEKVLTKPFMIQGKLYLSSLTNNNLRIHLIDFRLESFYPYQSHRVSSNFFVYSTSEGPTDSLVIPQSA